MEQVNGPVKGIQRNKAVNGLTKMKNGKAARPSEVLIKLIRFLGEEGIQLTTELLRRVWNEEKIPRDWRKSSMNPSYNKKGTSLSLETTEGQS